MAGYNEILVGRFNKALNAIFGIKAGAPSASLGGEVMPVFTMDQPGRVDQRYQEGWNRFGLFAQAAAQAAQGSGIRIVNRTPNTVAILEKIKFEVENPANAPSIVMRYGLTTAVDYNTLISPTALDARVGQGSVCSVSVTSAQAITSFGGNIDQYDFGANPGFQIFDILFLDDQELPLFGPGVSPSVGAQGFFSGFEIQTNVVNVILGATLWWRERVFEPSELR